MHFTFFHDMLHFQHLIVPFYHWQYYVEDHVETDYDLSLPEKRFMLLGSM